MRGGVQTPFGDDSVPGGESSDFCFAAGKFAFPAPAESAGCGGFESQAKKSPAAPYQGLRHARQSPFAVMNSMRSTMRQE
jgi:hypothetical protein